MKYLLDTNAWIEALNNPKGKLAVRLAGHVPSDIAISSVTLGELLVGAYKSSRTASNLGLIHQLVQQFVCLAFDAASADHYAQTRSHLEGIGQPIGPYDLQIAAIALQHGLFVVTHNVSEYYSRVPTLVVEHRLVP